MLPKTLTLALFAATVAADRLKPVTPVTPPSLEKRQTSCGIVEEECGTGCIPIGWTCCPGGSGGCDILETCVLGSNDEYGCCPIGRRCVGDGGVTSIGGDRGGGSVPTPTDDDDLFPEPTSTGGSSLGGDDDDDDLDFGDDDDDDLDFDDDDFDFTSTTRTTSARPTPTFSLGGDDDDDDDDDEGNIFTAGDEEGSAARNALSFVGAIAAAVLAL